MAVLSMITHWVREEVDDGLSTRRSRALELLAEEHYRYGYTRPQPALQRYYV